MPTVYIIVSIFSHSLHNKCIQSHFLKFIVTYYYRRVVIILEIEVIKPAEDVAGKIGDPTPYTEGKASKFFAY